MTSYEAQRDPHPLETVRTMAEAAVVATQSLDMALYGRRTGGTDVIADALCSIAASLLRLAGSPAPSSSSADGSHTDRLEVIERQLIALANSARELFARVDRLDEQLADD